MGASPAGVFVPLMPAQQPGVLVVPQQMHWCTSQPCWCFCNLSLSQCTIQLHCSIPPYYTSVSASSTSYIVAITPGVYIQCMPAQEPALLTFCEGVVTSSAGYFVAEWACTPHATLLVKHEFWAQLCKSCAVFSGIDNNLYRLSNNFYLYFYLHFFGTAC